MSAASAAASREVNCPQCGADTPVHGKVATACSGCDTLLVSLQGQVKRARGFEGHLPREDDTVALVCRLCAGALPDEVLKAGTGAKCTYCGERADIPPTILAMLRAMVTHPSAVPLAAKRVAQFWMGAAIAFAVIVGIYMFTPDTSVRMDTQVPLPHPELVKTEGDARFYRVSAQAGPLEFKPRGNLYPSMYLKAYDFKPGEVKSHDLIHHQEIFFLTTLIYEKTGERRTQWISMFDGAQFSRMKEIPEQDLSGEFRLHGIDRSYRLPVGKYRVEISEIILRGEGDPPAYIVCEWSARYSEMTLLFVFMFAAVAWILFLDVHRIARKKLGDTKWFGLPQWITIAAGIFLLVEVLHPIDPFGGKGAFEPQEAPAVPPVLMPKK
ncbi:hypothetical protein [Roseimicrobium sp. ORNL1]|uniref:hypothetical protein n=1 Tax=Roseimicrobium sp. ORNL1 TaxID=2711231 RepID=UPI0013E208AD|nr:hypothetical protein [Roseimicrobium sp. ORNL1]QIF02191.1 hypothetical protein G5S37_11830 [Roseimicrobium sp. ORNL1]